MTRHVIHAAGNSEDGYHKVAVAGSGGTFAIMARDLDGSCVPCGCGDPGDPCPDGCGPRCNTPGCGIFVGDTSVEHPCIEVEFGSYSYVDYCPQSPSFSQDQYYYVIMLGGRYKLQHTAINNYRGVYPCLVINQIRRRSDNALVFEQISNEVVVDATIGICQNFTTGSRCPMLLVARARVDAIGEMFNGGSASNMAYFGSPIVDEQNPLGCDPNEAQIVGTTAIAYATTSCEPTEVKHIAVSCGDRPDIVVDLATKPDGDYRGVRIGSDLYTVTNTRTDDPITPGYTWTTDRCWPRLALCVSPSVFFGYDPDTRPAGTLTALDPGGFRFTPVDGQYAPGPPASGLTWTSDPCPGAATPAGGDIADVGGPSGADRSNVVTVVPNPMDAVYAAQVAKQTGCIGCGG